jgi:para-nitrobenzyl esterase
MFRLDWETPVLGGMMKTPHGLEVPLVFDNVETKRIVLGPGPQPQILANAMANAWIAFARTGNPSQPGLAWPAYDAATRRTMLFNIRSRVVPDPDKPKRQLWTT